MGATTFLGNHAQIVFAGTDLSGDMNSLDINFKTPYIESTAFGDDWDSGISGVGGYTVALAGFVNKATGQNDQLFFSKMGGATSQTAAWIIGLAGTAANNPKYSGNGICTDFKEGVKVKSLASIALTIQGTGSPARGSY